MTNSADTANLPSVYLIIVNDDDTNNEVHQIFSTLEAAIEVATQLAQDAAPYYQYVVDDPSEFHDCVWIAQSRPNYDASIAIEERKVY